MWHYLTINSEIILFPGKGIELDVAVSLTKTSIVMYVFSLMKSREERCEIKRELPGVWKGNTK